MNRLSLAFFAVALLLVAVAVTALAVRVGGNRLAPVPAAAESVSNTVGPVGPAASDSRTADTGDLEASGIV